MDFAICLLVYILRPEYVPILSRLYPLGHFWNQQKRTEQQSTHAALRVHTNKVLLCYQ